MIGKVPNVRTVAADRLEVHMPILHTFTTIEPASVCYPRLNTTLRLEDIKMNDLGAPADSQSLDLVNKAEGLGLGSAVSLLLVK